MIKFDKKTMQKFNQNIFGAIDSQYNYIIFYIKLEGMYVAS